MTVPSLALSTADPFTIEGDALVLGVCKTDDGPRLLGDAPETAALQQQLEAIGFGGGQDELRRLPATVGAAGSVVLVGLGGGEITDHALRYAAGSVTRQLRGVDAIVFALPAATAEAALAVLEGAALGAYAYSEYRADSLESAKGPATSITVATDASDPGTDIAARAAALGLAVHTVRDLVNTPPSDLFPASFAERAVALAAGRDLTVTVLAEDALRDGGFGGILGVGQGSSRGPRLVKVEYAPAGAAKHLALVGKGITFDSGGLSLKPAGSMIGMKYDMTGAATVLSVALAAEALALPVRVTAWLCLAENLPSGTAIRPNDVLRIRGGKTVEVLNTDAEGRLVLADGLVAAGEEQPDAIIDVATLTGAASVALGNRYVATMGDSALVADVIAAADAAGETFWAMPIGAELRPLLNSEIADIANVRPGNTAGGMLIAAAFLKEFVGTRDDGSSMPWAHLDIAGTANNAGSGWGFTGKGPTGVAVRALIEFAGRFAAS